MYIFLGRNIACPSVVNTNGDKNTGISDAVYILGHLFAGANPAPPEPFPDAGIDPTDDELMCR